ncbi:MAG: hypothetical protein OHK0052_14620 [Anaerolineales bacterium]
MSKPLRVLFDLNVLLDVLQQRQPFYSNSARALACAELGLVQGWVAPHSLTTLFYLYAKWQSPETARVVLTDLLRIVSVTTVNASTIQTALALPYRDFEDAVQVASAAQAALTHVVTRNRRDFQPELLPTLEPSDLVALCQADDFTGA